MFYAYKQYGTYYDPVLLELKATTFDEAEREVVGTNDIASNINLFEDLELASVMLLEVKDTRMVNLTTHREAYRERKRAEEEAMRIEDEKAEFERLKKKYGP